MISLKDTGKAKEVSAMVAALALFIAGCHLPDVQPFANATAELRDSIEVTGEVTVARMKEDPKPFDPKNPPEPTDPAYPAWELAQAWEVRLAAANALVTYADALADITAAGNASADNVRDLAGAIDEIAAGLPGVAVPSQGLVSLATKLGEVAIKVRAAHDLAEAVEQAQPAVEGIAAILTEDWDDMLVLYQTHYRQHVRATFLDSRSDKSIKYLEFATYYAQLKSRVETLRAELQKKEFENPSGRDLIAEVREAEELLARAEAQANPYLEAYRDLERERQRVEALFEHAKEATAAWVQTHRDLASAIKANRRPNWRELLKTAQELHVLIDAIRADNRSIDRIELIK